MKAKIAIIEKGNIGWAIKQLLKENTKLSKEILVKVLTPGILTAREFLKGTDAVISVDHLLLIRILEQ